VTRGSARSFITAFNKLRIAEGHEWKTAFITRFGLFETLDLHFGLCNAPASFQHYINHTLYDLLDKICTAYLDDVLVYSKTRKEHREHVREVVIRLRDAGLQIDIDKCEFETTRTKYLGLIITPGGIEMDPSKVMRSYPGRHQYLSATYKNSSASRTSIVASSKISQDLRDR